MSKGLGLETETCLEANVCFFHFFFSFLTLVILVTIEYSIPNIKKSRALLKMFGSCTSCQERSKVDRRLIDCCLSSDIHYDLIFYTRTIRRETSYILKRHPQNVQLTSLYCSDSTRASKSQKSLITPK